MSCKHVNFRADVNVERLTNRKPIEYTAQVRIVCHDCGMPMAFLAAEGAPPEKRARVDDEGLRALLPMRPAENAVLTPKVTLLGPRQFTLPPGFRR